MLMAGGSRSVLCSRIYLLSLVSRHMLHNQTPGPSHSLRVHFLVWLTSFLSESTIFVSFLLFPSPHGPPRYIFHTPHTFSLSMTSTANPFIYFTFCQISQSKKLTSMHEKILETRARVKKVRFAPKSKLRRRRLRLVEDQLGNLRNALERGAREVRGAGDGRVC